MIDHSRLDEYFTVGDTIIIDMAPLGSEGRRYKTTIRGWQKDHYIILDKPEGESGISLSMKRDMVCVLRFIVRGEAAGFEAVVLGAGSNVQPIFLVTWPKTIHSVTLCKDTRIPTFLLCTMESESGQRAEGYILDLSQTGCRIQTPTAFEKNSRLMISFRLPAGGEYNRIPVDVCRFETLEHGNYLGCIFDETALGSLTELQVYINATLEGGLGGQSTTVRVMIFDPNPYRSQPIGHLLESRGIHVIYAKNILDGAYSLKALPPHVVLACSEQNGISGISLLSMLRTVPACELLPLMLYGKTDDPGIFREAAQHMITVIPPDATPKQISTECLRYLNDRLKTHI